jgi:hypothetical protein
VMWDMRLAPMEFPLGGHTKWEFNNVKAMESRSDDFELLIFFNRKSSIENRKSQYIIVFLSI